MNVGACQPLWSSQGQRRLWAAFHPPAGPMAGKRGILLVPPLLHEHPRSVRLLCEMATSLSALGIPCLRFAYFGTGDSDGSAVDADFASMTADIEQAAAELRTRGACSDLVLLVFRSGALPARDWISRASTPPSLVVLWDPVLEGAAWREELERIDAGKRLPAGAGDAGPAPGAEYLMGYPVPANFRSELDAAHWDVACRVRSVPVWIVASQEAIAALPSVERNFPLPPGTSAFGTGFTMSSADLLSPPMEQLMREWGGAVLAAG